MGDGQVAFGVLKFGVTQALVHVYLAPRQLRHIATDALHAVLHRGVHAVDELVNHDGAGVNHGVDWPVIVGQGELIKRLAGRLKANDLTDLVEA